MHKRRDDSRDKFRDEVLNNLSLNIKTRRENLSFSIAALALQSSVNTYSIVRIETYGANTTITTLIRLAEALGCTLADLFSTPPASLHLPAPANSSSKTTLRGVCWHKQKQKYQAKITKNKVTTYLGYFDSAEEASRAYNNAKRANMR